MKNKTPFRQCPKKYLSVIASMLLSTLLVSSIPAIATADDVVVPVGQQAAHKRDIAKPRSGMSKNQVESQYGTPRQSVPAIGQPPISSWVYADFVVYFEYNHVIHSVLTGEQRN